MAKGSANSFFQEYESGPGYFEWRRDYYKLQVAMREAGPDHLPCSQAPDFFFPSSNENDLASMAVKLCKECPIRAICADYAIKHERFGIWGGLSPNQRKAARRKRKLNGDL